MEKTLKKSKKFYDLKYLKGDLMGGFTTAVVALPLALALGVASGAGAKAGLYSAIITGILSTVFGGTPAQINGPTGAMTVVLIEVYQEFGLEALFAAMVLAGIFQILFGLLKLGKYIHVIPQPVIIGFTNGIGCLIFIKMIPYFQTHPLLALITIATMFGFPLITKRIPASLMALIVGTAAGLTLLQGGEVVGAIPTGLPQFTIPHFPLNELPLIVKSAFTLALLGGIESLLASLIVDDLTKTKHHSNKELIGQGIGNTVAALFGSLIGTGAIVRSGVNVNAGGRTRLSGILHGFILLAITLQFGPYASQIPLAVLGGILMGTSIKMVEYNATRRFTVVSKRAGGIILATTLLTVVLDLTMAVAIGTLLSMFAFVVKMGDVYLKKYEVDDSQCSKKISSYTIEGPLFFAVTNTIITRLEMASEDADIIILNLMNMPVLDSSGALGLKSIKESLALEGKIIYFAGLKDEAAQMLVGFDVMTDEEAVSSKRRILDVIAEVKASYPG